jgi:hypothetical protein
MPVTLLPLSTEQLDPKKRMCAATLRADVRIVDTMLNANARKKPTAFWVLCWVSTAS